MKFILEFSVEESSSSEYNECVKQCLQRCIANNGQNSLFEIVKRHPHGRSLWLDEVHIGKLLAVVLHSP